MRWILGTVVAAGIAIANPAASQQAAATIVAIGVSAGAPQNYAPPGTARVFAATRTTGGGDQTTISFAASMLERVVAAASAAGSPLPET